MIATRPRLHLQEVPPFLIALGSPEQRSQLRGRASRALHPDHRLARRGRPGFFAPRSHHVRELVDGYPIPIYYVNGNHDDAVLFHEEFGVPVRSHLDKPTSADYRFRVGGPA